MKWSQAMYYVLGLLYLVISMVMILEIIKAEVPNSTKILWIVVILVLPYIGILLYYFIGRRKMIG